MEHLNVYRDVFEVSSVGMAMCDASGQCVEVNDAMCKVAGASKAEVLKQNFNDLESWKRSGLRDAALKVLKENKPRHHEVSLITSFGHAVTIDYHIIPFEAGSRRMLLFVFNDVTERKVFEDEREKLIKELRQALDEIRSLRSLLPLCSFCKKIRDDNGYWQQVDDYIRNHLFADITHSVCPECAEQHYSGFYQKDPKS